MKNYKSANIRNIAVVGHGKTDRIARACSFVQLLINYQIAEII